MVVLGMVAVSHERGAPVEVLSVYQQLKRFPRLKEIWVAESGPHTGVPHLQENAPS